MLMDPDVATLDISISSPQHGRPYETVGRVLGTLVISW